MPPALVVIDVQYAIDDPSWGNDRNNPDCETNIARLLALWRERDWPRFLVKHVSRDPHSTYRASDFKQEVAPRDGDRVIEKSTNSAFIGTTLETELRAANAGAVVITGVITNNSVEATARMSGNLDFATIVVSDATATFGRFDSNREWRTARDVHAMSLANLAGEYARILTTGEVLAAFA
jgi:nicotinamidase-related amidase